MIRVSHDDFDLNLELNRLKKTNVGAVVSFVGLVRDHSPNGTITALTLEHYPGMTENQLQGIVDEAKNQWDIEDVTVIHRVGELALGDNIVLIIVASAHRLEAFQACEFILEALKKQATFWKKEFSGEKAYWVNAVKGGDS
jgi:molybdopterin synthase catalytic subunit